MWLIHGWLAGSMNLDGGLMIFTSDNNCYMGFGRDIQGLAKFISAAKVEVHVIISNEVHIGHLWVAFGIDCG